MASEEMATRGVRSQQGTRETLLALHSQSLGNDYRREGLWAWLEPRIPANGRVLDAGCGTGFMTRELVRRGCDVVAVDPDAEPTEVARRILTDEGLSADVRQLMLGKGQLAALGRFDGILCLDVIEHIEDDAAALQELRDALEDDGVLLLSVPAVPWLYGKRDETLGHYRRYDRRMLLDVCRRSSLQVQEIRYWNTLGVPIYFAYERLLRRPIADGLRAVPPGEQSWTSGIARRALAFLLRAESRSPLAPPLGLSLLAVCTRSSGTAAM